MSMFPLKKYVIYIKAGQIIFLVELRILEYDFILLCLNEPKQAVCKKGCIFHD